jgi:DnaJ family protein B protein 4
MSKKDDFYKLLGVERTCSAEDIKKAYRKLAMKWHPDKHVQDTAEEKKIAEDKFKEINQAYEILGNPNTRKQYDMGGMNAFSGHENGHHGFKFHDASDIFNSFFKSFDGDNGFNFRMDDMSGIGGMNGFRGFSTMNGKRGSTVYVDPKTGRTVHINMNHHFNKKSKSKDSGSYSRYAFDSDDSDTEIPIKDAPIVVDLELTLEEMYKGATKKRKITRTIKTPRVERSEEEVVTIIVKPGWKEGTKIKFENRGDVNPGREPADIIFVVKQKPHADFKRNDNNIVTTVTITQDEADYGFEKTIRDFLDNEIQISLKKGIPDHNYVHKIKHAGMPIRKEGRVVGYGDMLVGFNIKKPDISPDINTEKPTTKKTNSKLYGAFNKKSK